MLGQLRGAASEVAARNRTMPEHIAQTLTELITYLGDALIGRAAMRACIAAVLDQCDFRPFGTEDMVAFRRNGTGKPVNGAL